MMNAIVTNYLNVRVGKPSVNAPCYQYLAPGSQLQVDDKFYKGDSYNGNDDWLKDAAGNYYWSGGVQLQTVDVLIPAIKKSTEKKYALREMLKLNVMLPSFGENVVVAVVDTGVGPHPALSRKVVQSRSFISGKPPQDDNGHGSGMGGIICAANELVEGIATKANLVSCKVVSGISVNGEAVLEALGFLVQQESIDVVNMSLDIHEAYLPDLQKLIDTMCDKGIITIISAGEDNTLNTIAGLDRVIRVGIIHQENLQQIKQDGLNPKYTCAFLNQEINGLALNNGYRTWARDSAYAAVTTGIVSAFLGSKPPVRNDSRFAEVIDFIKEISTPFTSITTPERFKPYRP
jgi:subtilisin family serine protease